jgi:uncharacterized membrane protein YcaP (DUF421 family)
MTDLFEILLHVLIGFISLLVLVRILGNKQLGQLNIFTYISGIVIGSMIADSILHEELNMWRSVIGTTAWVILVLLVEFISLKSIKARELLDGQPIILIKKGQIIFDALKKERMNLDDLTMMLRTNMVFSILDVDYAILEPNGDLSILKKQHKDNVTKADMQVPTKEPTYLPTSIIIDGKIISKNLTELGLSKNKLDVILNQLNIQHHDVLYAELQSDGQLYLQLRDGSTKQKVLYNSFHN